MPHDYRKNEWTIVYLIYADLRDNLNTQKVKRELKALFDALRETQKSNRVDLLVVYNVIRPMRTFDQDVSYVYKLSTATNKKGFRLRMAFRPFRTPAFLQKTEHLGRLMNKIFTWFKAKRQMVLTWDHGSIFGIFKIEKPVNTVDEEALKKDCRYLYEKDGYLYFANKSKPHGREWDQTPAPLETGTESEKSELLTNEELSAIISKGLGGKKKLDILIMMNCFVQNIYAAHALNPSVRYLIGPQGAIDEPGYNYKVILSTLMKDPFMKADKLVDLSVNSLKTLTEDATTTAAFKAEIQTWAVLGTSLRIIPKAIDLLDELGTFLQTAIDDSLTLVHLRNIRENKLYPFDAFRNTAYLVDLKNLIQQLRAVLDHEPLTRFEQSIVGIETDYCRVKFLGDQHYNLGGTDFSGFNTPPTGISVYFPKDKSVVANDDFLLLNETALKSRVPQWNAFIDKYHQLVQA